MKLQKIITYLLFVVGVLSMVLWVVMNNSISTIMSENGLSEHKEITPDLYDPVVSPLYTLLIVVFVIVLLATVVSIVNSLAKKPGAFKKVLIPTVAFIVVILISYFFASGDNVDLQPFLDKGQDVTEATSEKVGAGLIAFYILVVAAVLSMAWSGVKKLVN